MHRILLVHGPNLNLLGVREPDVYGSTTLGELVTRVTAWGEKLGLGVSAYQSNHEGAIIDRLHAARDEVDGLILNLGALSHTSYALHDAIVATDLPAVEVHISNVKRRERWRRRSATAPACLYAIYGRGLVGYRDALRVLQIRTADPPALVRYGDDAEQVMDLRSPSGNGPFPTALFLHGGFWRSEWTRDTIDGLAADLARRGWLSANAEYRRLDVGGGWPQTVDDVRSALEVLAARPDADMTRLLLVGHSAGGHLALLAAQHIPATVIGMAAVTDLTAAHEAGTGEDSVARFMGGSPAARPQAYAAAVAGVSGDVILVHGSDDQLVPPEQSRAFADRHSEVDLVEYPDTGHFELLDPARSPWQDVVTRLN